MHQHAVRTRNDLVQAIESLTEVLPKPLVARLMDRRPIDSLPSLPTSPTTEQKAYEFSACCHQCTYYDLMEKLLPPEGNLIPPVPPGVCNMSVDDFSDSIPISFVENESQRRRDTFGYSRAAGTSATMTTPTAQSITRGNAVASGTDDPGSNTDHQVNDVHLRQQSRNEGVDSYGYRQLRPFSVGNGLAP